MFSSTTTSDMKLERNEVAAKPPQQFTPQSKDQSAIDFGKSTCDDSSSAPTPEERFLPQPIETSTSSSKFSVQEGPELWQLNPDISQPSLKRRQCRTDSARTTTERSQKFAPQLLETSTSKLRRAGKSGSIEAFRPSSSDVKGCVTEGKARIKFTPQLIETAKRTRKAGDIRPAHLPSERTDAVPASVDTISRFRSAVPPAPSSNSSADGQPVMSSAEARRVGVPLPKRNYTDCSLRQHSFHVPDLETIESSESEEDCGPPSPSSHSPYQRATRMRESVDASSSGYVLELAAKAAETQLRDQALDAFPNDDRHIQVDHWIDRDSDMETAMSSRSEFDHRRVNSGNWELNALRKRHEEIESHQEKAQKQREARRKQRNNVRPQDDNSVWSNNVLKELASNTDRMKGAEVEKMRAAARPPMLGSDIKFPRCASPAGARFDVTQGSSFLRTAMCYLSEQTVDEECKEGLWAPKAGKETECVPLWSRSISRPLSPGGLWAGCCTGASNISPPRGPTGITTPTGEDEQPLNWLEKKHAITNTRHLPPSPPPSNSGMTNLDDKLSVEQSIEAEFNSSFITQVYNYLSLGYPSLAQKFDTELSKISKIPVSELRLDDTLSMPRGYIRLGEDESALAKGDCISEEMCARWKALRIYIHEWARQQRVENADGSTVALENQHQAGFGVRMQRGSWAW